MVCVVNYLQTYEGKLQAFKSDLTSLNLALIPIWLPPPFDKIRTLSDASLHRTHLLSETLLLFIYSKEPRELSVYSP